MRLVVRLVVLLSSAALFAVACEPPAPDEVVRIRFDNAAVGNQINPVNNGTGALEMTLLTSNGGTATSEASVPGQGNRANMPNFDGSASAPRAVVSITNNSSATEDLLNPGSARFEFGADVTLDATNAAAGTNDDGNNLMQRGLYTETSQFKLEVDGGRPACRVKDANDVLGGVLQAVAVTSSVTLTPDSPYRLRCVRDGDTVTLSVTPIQADGSLGTTTSNTNSGPLVGLSFDQFLPVSVGGKLNPSGSIASNTDQFNGTIDNAVLIIG